MAVSPGDDVEALVVGGGMAGIRATVALKRAGVDRVALLEKSDQLGGVWHHNRYPGVGCDVPASTYSYGFRPADWSRLFAGGREIREYFQSVADENDVVRHVRFNTELLDAAWDDDANRWICATSAGAFRARFLVLATGVLHSAAVPDIPGKDAFTGTMFHSVRWPADFDPAGRRIAVVGTGASAIQFVPRIQPHAERLVVLQRTPPWLVPKNDKAHRQVDPRRALRRQRLLRAVLLGVFDVLVWVLRHARLSFLVSGVARRHLRDSVADPELRAILTPDYKVGCKRMLLSDDYYPAITQDNVDYVASGLAEIRAESVLTTDGREFGVDTIIWATGFHFGLQIFENVRGRDGQSVAKAFDGTFKSTTIAGCPNMFVIAGPNAVTASVPVAAEAQARYLESAITTMRRHGLDTIEVRRDAQERWTRRKDAKLRHSVWNVGGCRSYYLNDKGVNVAAWPGGMRGMARQLRSFDLDKYVVTRADV